MDKRFELITSKTKGWQGHERSSTLLVIGKIQIEASARYHHMHSIRMAKIFQNAQNPDNTKCRQECGVTGTLTDCWQECKMI